MNYKASLNQPLVIFLSAIPEDHGKDRKYNLNMQSIPVEDPGQVGEGVGSSTTLSAPKPYFSKPSDSVSAVWFTRAAVTKHHKLNAFNNRNSSAHGSRAGSPRSRC